jgi:phenylacetic acid degradation operon negative regulatory protein
LCKTIYCIIICEPFAAAPATALASCAGPTQEADCAAARAGGAPLATTDLAMTPDHKIRDLIDDLLEPRRPNAKSLIVSVFGDAILPHGGSVALTSLVELMALFGVNERGVRTSVFRLAREGWLSSHQVGRRSYYALTESGRLRFQAAHQAIYAAGPQPWNGVWTFVLTGLFAPETRERLRGDLSWQGFGQILPGVMVHPSPDEQSLRQALRDAGITEGGYVINASGKDWMGTKDLRDIVGRAWDLDALAAGYQSFLETFRPFVRLVGDATPSPETCFRLRTLLIHDYRRALLRDPRLPDELLPAAWPGAAARLLCRNIYRQVQAGAESHLVSHLETAEGPLPDADPSYFQRFGSLVAEA